MLVGASSVVVIDGAPRECALYTMLGRSSPRVDGCARIGRYPGPAQDPPLNYAHEIHVFCVALLSHQKPMLRSRVRWIHGCDLPGEDYLTLTAALRSKLNGNGFVFARSLLLVYDMIILGGI